MAAPGITREAHAAIVAGLAEGKSKTSLSLALGLNRTTIIRYSNLPLDDPRTEYARGGAGVAVTAPAAVPPVWSGVPEIVAELMRDGPGKGPEASAAPDGPEAPDGPTDFKREERDDAAVVEFSHPTRIRTLEDAVAYAEVDLAVWRVEKWSCVSWETGMKLRRFGDRGRVTGEQPHQTQQWRIKIELRRILPKSLQDATAAVFEAMKAHAPKYPPLPARKTPARPHLCVVDLFDVHFGKLAWGPEVNGESYDLHIAEMLYRNAVLDILAESSHRPIEEFVLPVGQDFLHVDNLQNTTTNGTPQDTDGRLAKIIETGERAVIWAVEQLAAVAPVRVLYVPGNHDRAVSLCLVRTIAAWFRTVPHVTVDSAPTIRKAHRYGDTLLAFTHGDEEKDSSLAGIMANEFKQDFCETTTHEWHRGHRHRPKKVETTPVNYAEGVVIRDLRSLSAVDAWHYRKGLIGGTRAAEAYFYEKTGGFVCQFVAKARQSA